MRADLRIASYGERKTWVQPEIAKSTLTLAYERKGLGLSSPATQRHDGVSLAAELHELLRAKKLKRPYILVGHSLGGTIVQVFASRYPKEVQARCWSILKTGASLRYLRRL